MNKVSVIRASILAHLIEQIEQTNLSADALLARHGLMKAQIADPYFRVPLSRYVPLFEDAAQLLGMPHLGALLGTRITPRDLGPAGVLFSVSPTILDGLVRLTRHIMAIQSSTTNGLRLIEGNYVWTYQLSAAKLWPRRQESEFTLSSSCQLIRSSFSRNWRPLEVHFEHDEPPDTKRLEAIFRAPLKFGQSSNRLIIAPADAERVYRSDDTDIVTVLEQHILQLEARDTEQSSLAQRVKSLIGIHLGHRRVTVALLAADLGMAARTLQRRLAEEGTSLRSLVEEYRRDIVEMQMKAGTRKMRIADTLGYADSTVLWRARKRWRHLDE